MPAVLREGHTPPPEQLLQQIWQYQRIHRGELRTTDGRRVAVLHPGFMNLEAGPDFQRAYIQVGRAAPVECDVEIDVASGGWQQHGHHTNPAISGVGLQVVWQAGNGGPTDLPVVELKDQLDAPVGELSHALAKPPTAQPPGTLGRCAAPLADLLSAHGDADPDWSSTAELPSSTIPTPVSYTHLTLPTNREV